jgi:hypothetical protein
VKTPAQGGTDTTGSAGNNHHFVFNLHNYCPPNLLDGNLNQVIFNFFVIGLPFFKLLSAFPPALEYQ